MSHPGQGLHVDLTAAGKGNGQLILGYDGTLHALGITDDYSRYINLIMLPSKSELTWTPAIKAHVAYWTARGVSTLWLRADNAFDCTAFKSWCLQQGIKCEFTAPYSPQQNGVVEGRLRIAWQRARIIMQQSGIQVTLWPEALLYAVWTINRQPCSANDRDTPYLRYFGHRPDLTMQRPFGCLAYRKIHTGGHLQPDAEACVNMGLDDNRKAWKLWSLDKRQVVRSRDVHFAESISKR